MSKMSVSDAAAHFGISKEAIHNRIRRGSLEVIVENGIKMVVLDTSTNTTKSKPRASASKSNGNSDKYYKLLEEQNAKLQSRVDVLEGETRSLRDQKELMLIEERKKIENIYKEKDEQLKNILTTLSSQFMLSAPESIEEEMVEVEIEESIDVTLISLKKYLKSTSFSEKKREKIKAKFKKRAKKDERIVMLGNKIYLDPTKYDYKDLI